MADPASDEVSGIDLTAECSGTSRETPGQKRKVREMLVATWSDPQRRLDLHNISVDFAAASSGRCGFTHLDSGRVCQLPHRHSGPCHLQPQCRKHAAPAGTDLV
jgi:hypothetical protein